MLSPISPRGEWRTLHRPAHGGYVGEVDLHWNADRLLFTQSDATNWKVFELRTDGSGLRQVSTMPDDVDSFDACYLPNGKIMFGSTATFQSVPCWHGLKRVSNLYLMDADGSSVRQVCFDQDHDFHSTVLPNGQVLYNRWDCTGINHIYLRELMLMNPDGTGQRAIYGSGSWYPNALYFPRPLPGDAGKIVCILSGYHGPHRMGQLVILDTAKGWQEAEGIVQRISGRGDPIKPMVKDNLVEGDWPKFLHPFPLSEKYFLVAAWLHAKANWGIYLADVFDNLVLVREEPGWALLEPVLLKSQPKPPVVPEQVDLTRDDGLVYLHDVHVGPGLQGVPRGTVKSLRVLAYHFGYLGLAGPDRIGYGGPWEVMRILGTVPLEADGSAFFRVPANTPIALQPLDGEGKAVQLMRSWFSVMPGEYHADTSPLIQMLRKGHHGVQLDAESWDRLVTWIDLNAPCHGTWGEVYPIPDGAHERRMALRRQFGGPKEDPEEIPQSAIRRKPKARNPKTNPLFGTRNSEFGVARRPTRKGHLAEPRHRPEARSHSGWRVCHGRFGGRTG